MSQAQAVYSYGLLVNKKESRKSNPRERAWGAVWGIEIVNITQEEGNTDVSVGLFNPAEK